MQRWWYFFNPPLPLIQNLFPAGTSEILQTIPTFNKRLTISQSTRSLTRKFKVVVSMSWVTTLSYVSWRDHKAHGLYADGSTSNGTTYGAWLVMNTRDT